MTEPTNEGRWVSGNDRCDWSDLPADQCAHCGAAPGNDFTLEPSIPRGVPVALEEQRPLERATLPPTWSANSTADECRCGRPTRDHAWLCDQCQTDLADTLADLPQLDAEVDVTMTRQRAAATTGGPRSTETSLPWHERAGDARRTLHGLLVSWVRFCVDETVRGPQIADPTDTVPSLAGWLTTRVAGLSLHDIAPEAMDEITDAAAECHRIVFYKRKHRVYLGTCAAPLVDEDGNDTDPCPGEVYADEGEPVGYCDDCGQGVTVVIRKTEIDRQLDDRLCTPAEIATYAVHLGLDIPREKVRRRVNYWHRHGLIEHKGDSTKGEPLFRYGDVRNRLYAEYVPRAS